MTWQYPQGPQTQPVHAFPNIKLDGEGKQFPIQIQNIASIPVDVEWSYGIGYQVANSTDVTSMAAALVNANVAIDMFLDPDMNAAQSPTEAKYEIMVWLCTIGPATQPIGFDKGAVATQVVNGTTFELYFGENSLSQYVLTWSATEPVENFVGDIAPLVTTTGSLGLADFPSSINYLGYMGLGSETLWSPQEVTFDVSYLSMDVKRN